MNCPRTAHALSTITTRRLHAFYARVGAAIPLTSTVLQNPLGREDWKLQCKLGLFG